MKPGTQTTQTTQTTGTTRTTAKTTTDEQDGSVTGATVPQEPALPSRSSGSQVDPPRRGRVARLIGDARTHVLAWFVAVVAIAVVGSVLIGRQILLARLDARIDRELGQEVEELRRLATGDDPETGEPFAGDVERIFDLYVLRNVAYPHERVFFYTNGEPYRPEQLPDGYQPPANVERQWAAVTSSQRGRFMSDVGDVDYLAIPLEQTRQTRGVFVVAIYGDVERDDIGQVVETMALVGVVAILVAAGLAWFGAGRILAPIRRLTQTAAAISDRDLLQRIEVDGDDDVARLARTFNAMLDRLQHAFATQRQFLNDVGHELRTPITIVRGHLEVLGDDPDERRETVALVIDELERMRRLVGDLVVLAKAEQPDFLDLAPIDAGDLAREIARKAERLADRTWRLEACDSGVIVADRQRLTQAAVQLAHNAVQHTGDGETIALGVSLIDNEARFWVRDSGPGFGGTDPRRLFERFAGERTGGTGLGLSIVKAIAQAHGGDVQAREAPGGGALFTITVPRRPTGGVALEDA